MPQAALADYELAMQVGGERIVKMYQCGLRSQGLYFGAVDGVYSPAVRHAMRTCTGNRQLRSASVRCGMPARGLLIGFTPYVCATAANRCTASEICAVQNSLTQRRLLAHCARADELWTNRSAWKKSHKVQV